MAGSAIDGGRPGPVLVKPANAESPAAATAANTASAPTPGASAANFVPTSDFQVVPGRPSLDAWMKSNGIHEAKDNPASIGHVYPHMPGVTHEEWAQFLKEYEAGQVKTKIDPYAAVHGIDIFQINPDLLNNKDFATQFIHDYAFDADAPDSHITGEAYQKVLDLADLKAVDDQGRPLLLKAGAQQRRTPFPVVTLIEKGADPLQEYQGFAGAFFGRKFRGEVAPGNLHVGNTILEMLMNRYAPGTSRCKPTIPSNAMLSDEVAQRVARARTPQGNTLLHTSPEYSSLNGSYNRETEMLSGRAVRALVKAGADVEAKNSKGQTPMVVQLLSGNPAAAVALAQSGATVPTVDPETGLSLRPFAAGAFDLLVGLGGEFYRDDEGSLDVIGKQFMTDIFMPLLRADKTPVTEDEASLIKYYATDAQKEELKKLGVLERLTPAYFLDPNAPAPDPARVDKYDGPFPLYHPVFPPPAVASDYTEKDIPGITQIVADYVARRDAVEQNFPKLVTINPTKAEIAQNDALLKKFDADYVQPALAAIRTLLGKLEAFHSDPVKHDEFDRTHPQVDFKPALINELYQINGSYYGIISRFAQTRRANEQLLFFPAGTHKSPIFDSLEGPISKLQGRENSYTAFTMRERDIYNKADGTPVYPFLSAYMTKQGGAWGTY